MIRTKDNQLIKRSDAAFILEQHPEDKKLFRSLDGTIYERDAHGTMRRLTLKKSEKRKKR